MPDQSFPENQIGIEAAVPSVGGFTLPAKDYTRVHAFYGRICRISVDGGPSGSGFLVGPDLVLTASHVIQECAAAPYAGRNFQFRFLDSKLEKELLLCSAPSSELKIEAQAYEQNGKIDYCFIRLPRKIGLMPFAEGSLLRRGWFTICDDRPRAPAAGHFMMFHFPTDGAGGSPVPMFSPGSILDRSRDNATIYHDARTEVGSSGAICICQSDMSPSFIHLGQDGRKANRNAGLSITRIVEEIRGRHHILMNELYDQSYSDIYPRQTIMRQPIINRDQFLEKIFRMANGTDLLPVYAVGSRELGRSFLGQIIKTVSPSAPLFVIDLANREFRDPYTFAAELVSELPVRHRFKFERPSSEPEAAWFRWFVGEYLASLARMITEAQALSGWVFIDSIDYDFDFIMDFVGHCIRRAPHVTNLRLCFAGSAKPTFDNLDYVPLNRFSERDIQTLVHDFGSTLEPAWNGEQIQSVLDTFFEATDFATLSFTEQIEAAKSILRFMKAQTLEA